MKRKERRDRMVSVRMSDELIQLVQAMAIVEGDTVGEEIRRAVEERIESRRNDPAFQQRVQDARARQEKAMLRLTGATPH